MFWGGGQPCGLVAAQAQGRRPPSAGGGLQNTTDSHSEALCIELFADLSTLPRRVCRSHGGFFTSLDMGLAGGLR
jgi:hypothetical protein